MKTPHPAEHFPPLELRGRVIRKLTTSKHQHAYTFRAEAAGPLHDATVIHLVIHAPTVTLDPDDYCRLTVHTDEPEPGPGSTFHHFPVDTRITTRHPRSPRK